MSLGGELVLVKLGGSLITRKERRGTARTRRIVLLARQIAEVRRAGSRLLLGHGSGSFGHPAAASHGLQHGITSADQLAGVSRTQALAHELHALVLHQLEAAGALPFSLPPGAFLVADGGEPAEVFLEPIERTLELGLLPVVFGDVVTDRRQGVAICSTEAVFAALARGLAARGHAPARALWLGDTPGVLDALGRTVPRLDAEGWNALRAEVGAARGVDVTGGMALRVETALALARLGIDSWLLDGRPDRALTRAMAGDSMAGTHVPSTAG